MPPGASDHIPILVYFLAGIIAMLGIAWRGFVWLRGQIRAEFSAAMSGDEFRRIIQREVSAAFTGQAEIDATWRRGIESDVKRIEERQGAQATSIVEAHRRIDRLMETGREA